MTRKIAMVALMLCISYIGRAQVEQEVKQIAEKEHKRFANELPIAFKKGQISIFGIARTEKNQFFLEDDVNTFVEILGWNLKGYNQRNISSVFLALSEKSKPGPKNANPLNVTIDFPDTPSESNASIKMDSKGKLATYVVTTKANVTVEVVKQGAQSSVARNTVTLKWEGKVSLNNGTVDRKKKITPPELRSIKVSEPEVTVNKELVMQAAAKNLIEEYYSNLQSPAKRSAVLAPDIPNKADLAQWLQNSILVEIGSGSVNVPLPAKNSQIIEVRNVPNVTIYVDPAPYMTESPLLYSTTQAYHRLAPTFTVDLQAEKIIKVVYNGEFIRPKLEPKLETPTVPTVVVTEAQPIVTQPQVVPRTTAPKNQPRGLHYKIQILSLEVYKPLSELPAKFRVENVSVEKYSDGYKYVVPAGNTMQEALALQRILLEGGLEETWVAVYENGERVRPDRGRPEIVE